MKALTAMLRELLESTLRSPQVSRRSGSRRKFRASLSHVAVMVNTSRISFGTLAPCQSLISDHSKGIEHLRGVHRLVELEAPSAASKSSTETVKLLERLTNLVQGLAKPTDNVNEGRVTMHEVRPSGVSLAKTTSLNSFASSNLPPRVVSKFEFACAPGSQ
eukprot:4710734-Amphidinium_carterae.1